MINELLDFLKEERKVIFSETYPYLNDTFLDVYKSKFCVLDFNNLPHSTIGGAQKQVIVPGESNTHNEITDKKIYFKKIYSQIADMLKRLEIINKNLVNKTIRNIFVEKMYVYFNEIIDTTNAQFFLYTLYHNWNPIFPYAKYIVNEINSEKNDTIVMIMDIPANMETKFSESICVLMKHNIENNVIVGGNFIFYFLFAPWLDDYYECVLLYFLNNFASVKIVFPSMILPLSNKCFFICQNKLSSPKNITITEKINEKCISFSKKIAFLNLNNIKILMNLINNKMESEAAYTVLSNKIFSHFNSLPLY